MGETEIELNKVLSEKSPALFESLSELGKRIYMPKGIIFQSDQAKDHSKKYNASIGIAAENIGFDGTSEIKIENLGPMVLKSIKKHFNHLTANEIFNYAPPSGDPKLRKLWQEKIVKQNPCLKLKSDISLPVVVGGLTHGITTFADLFVNKDDEIIMADKIWENYNLIFSVRFQAKIRYYQLFNEENTGYNLKGLEDAIATSKKDKIILLFNFPNNPTGYTALEKEQNAIRDMIIKYADKGKKIIAVCDDAYYGLFYNKDIYPGSIFSKLAGIHKNVISVKVDGVSKEDYAWGFRIGFITFADYYKDPEVYSAIEQKTIACIRSSVSSCSRSAQSIFVNTINDEHTEKEKAEKFNILRKREDKVREEVFKKEYKDLWDVYPFNSGYFMCLRIKGVSAEDVRQHALLNHGLGTIALGTDLRVAFSCIEEKNIESVFKIIAQSITEVKAGK